MNKRLLIPLALGAVLVSHGARHRRRWMQQHAHAEGGPPEHGHDHRACARFGGRGRGGWRGPGGRRGPGGGPPWRRRGEQPAENVI